MSLRRCARARGIKTTNSSKNKTNAQEILPVSYNWGIGGAQRYVESGFDRGILPAETLDYLIEVEYLLEELPASGEETRCKDNPQTG